MLRRLKKSRKSSNFWTDFATVASTLLMVATAVLSDPTVAADLTWKQGLIMGMFKLANILQHMYKNDEYDDKSSDPTPVG